jgi:hypothetical protein
MRESRIARRIGAAVFAWALLQASLAHALDLWTVYTGKIEQVRVDENGRGFIVIPAQTSGGHALCRASYNNDRLAFDSNTAGGKSILQVARAAHLSERTIHVVGTGDCDTYSNIEDIARIYMN